MSPKRTRKRIIDPHTRYLFKQAMVGVILAIVLVLLGTGVWYGSRIDSLTINTVAVVGGVTINKDEVKKAVEDRLDGTYYRLVPKRFSWTYPKQNIMSAVKTIDRVKQVDVELTDARTLTVVFDEYIPFALWCVEPDSTNCLFIDKQGYAFSQAPQLTGGSFVRYVSKGEIVAERGKSIPREVLNKTESFISGLEQDLGFYVTVVEVDAANDAYYTLAGGGELKVALGDDPTTVLTNLKSIISTEAFSHLTPGNFQYIDLRFGDKVYVNEEAASTQSEEAATESEGEPTFPAELVPGN